MRSFLFLTTFFSALTLTLDEFLLCKEVHLIELCSAESLHAIENLLLSKKTLVYIQSILQNLGDKNTSFFQFLYYHPRLFIKWRMPYQQQNHTSFSFAQYRQT